MAQGNPKLPHHRQQERDDFIFSPLGAALLSALFPLGLIALLAFAMVLPELLAWLFGGVCS